MTYLKKDIDPAAFLSAVAQCHGEITFLTTAGDQLNLKSELCQLLFAFIVSRPALVKGAVIQCSEEQDRICLQPYLEEDDEPAK